MDALVAGHICIDLTPDLTGHGAVGSVGDLLRPGHLIDTRGLTVSLGGAVANTGLSLARMGASVSLVARVGDDPLAALVRRELEAVEGGEIAIDLTTAAGERTSFSVILAVNGVDRIFLHDSGANDRFSAADLASALEGSQSRGATPRLFHFGYPTAVASMYRRGPAPLAKLLRTARDFGMTTSVDFSFPDPEGEAAAAPWREILSAAMPVTDLCFPSLEELSILLDPRGFRERERAVSAGTAVSTVFDRDYAAALSGELLEMGAAVVIVKMGSEGLLLRWNDGDRERLRNTGALALEDRLPLPDAPATGEAEVPGIVHIPALPPERVVSATGAGDAAIAGVLAALLAGRRLDQACRIGCVAGRNAIQVVDAVSAAVPFDELEAATNTEAAINAEAAINTEEMR